LLVIPAKAGIQFLIFAQHTSKNWIPGSAVGGPGMTALFFDTLR